VKIAKVLPSSGAAGGGSPAQPHGKKGVPPWSASTRCEGCGDYAPCGKTHGKNGVPPLPAIPEVCKVCGDTGRVFDELTLSVDACPRGCRPTGEKSGNHEVEAKGLRCQETGCDAFAISPRGWCRRHDRPVEGKVEVRRCKGIPVTQDPGEACECVLGPEVKGDRCAICEGWMIRCGECDGCNGHLPGWNVTGKLCSDCRALRQHHIANPWEYLEVERHRVARDFEDAWTALAARSDVDAETFAACKALRDLEVGK